jgi:hypothetical protein
MALTRQNILFNPFARDSNQKMYPQEEEIGEDEENDLIVEEKESSFILEEMDEQFQEHLDSILEKNN